MLNNFLSHLKGNIQNNLQKKVQRESFNAGTLSNQTLGSQFTSQQHLLKTLSETLGGTRRRNISRNTSKNNILFSDEKFSSGSKTQRGFYSTVNKKSKINSETILKPKETKLASPRMVYNSTSKKSKLTMKHNGVQIMADVHYDKSNLDLRHVKDKPFGSKTKAIGKTSSVNTLGRTRKNLYSMHTSSANPFSNTNHKQAQRSP